MASIPEILYLLGSVVSLPAASEAFATSYRCALCTDAMDDGIQTLMDALVAARVDIDGVHSSPHSAFLADYGLTNGAHRRSFNPTFMRALHKRRTLSDVAAAAQGFEEDEYYLEYVTTHPIPWFVSINNLAQIAALPGANCSVQDFTLNCNLALGIPLLAYRQPAAFALARQQRGAGGAPHQAAAVGGPAPAAPAAVPAAAQHAGGQEDPAALNLRLLLEHNAQIDAQRFRQQAQEQRRRDKVKQLTITQFSGRPSEYAHWRKELFALLVDDADLRDHFDDVIRVQKTLEALPVHFKDKAALVERKEGCFAKLMQIVDAEFKDESTAKEAFYHRIFSIAPVAAWDDIDSVGGFASELRVCLQLMDTVGETDAGLQVAVTYLKNQLPSSGIKFLIRRNGGSFPAIYTPSMLLKDLDAHIKGLKQLAYHSPSIQQEAAAAAFLASSKPDSSRNSKVTQPFHHAPSPVQGKKKRRGEPKIQPKDIKSRREPYCRLCPSKGEHWTTDCPNHISPFDRRRRAIALSLCFKCLGGHNFKECQSKGQCRVCNDSGHHSALHNASIHSKKEPGPQEAAAAVFHNQGAFQTLAVIAPRCTIMMESLNRRTKTPVHSYIDSGASYTYLSLQLLRQLGLKCFKKEYVNLSTSGSSALLSSLVYHAKVRIYDLNGDSAVIHIRAREFLMGPLPIQGISMPSAVTTDIRAKGPVVNMPSPHNSTEIVDCIVGTDLIALFFGADSAVEEVQHTNGFLNIHHSPYGKILMGSVPSSSSVGRSETACSAFEDQQVCASSADPISDPVSPLSPLVDLVTLGMEPSSKESALTQEAEMENLRNSFVRESDGRISVPLPLKVDPPPVFKNRRQALQRLFSGQRKLELNQRVQYFDIFQDYHAQGMIEEVEPLKPDEPGCYIAHFSVLRESSTFTKVRPVFDAASNTGNGSLNFYLRDIRPLNSQLLRSLLNFRVFKEVLTGDIAKAFLQVGILPAHRRYLRFFMLRDPTGPIDDSNVVEYQWTRMMFGTAPAPFLLSGVIQLIIEDIRANKVVCLHDMTSAFREHLANNLALSYADNLVFSFTSASEGIEIYNAIRSTFAEYQLPIREWNCSMLAVKQAIPEDERDPVSPAKFLGTQWWPNDYISIKTPKLTKEELSQPTTLASLASQVPRFYDVLGLLAPAALKARSLVQDAWERPLGWNDELPDDLQAEWRLIQREYAELGNFRFPRCVIPKESDSSWTQRLMFCADASDSASGVGAYIHSESPDSQQVDCHLLMAKVFLAPRGKQAQTTPRHELTACRHAARLKQTITNNLSSTVDVKSTELHSDSTIALSWICSPKVLKVYEENRKQEILASGFDKISYIPTSLNSADLLTRPLSLSAFTPFMEFYHRGPKFFKQPYCTWPLFKTPNAPDGFDIGDPTRGKRPKEQTSEASAIGAEKDSSADEEPVWPFGWTFEKAGNITFIDFPHRLRLTALMSNGCDLSSKEAVANSDLRKAFGVWALAVQKAHKAYQKDFSYLSKLSKNSIDFSKHGSRAPGRVRDLRLYCDEDGTLRAAGRFWHQETDPRIRDPPILPSKSPLTMELMSWLHQSHSHASPGLLVTLTRRWAWVSNTGSVARLICQSCKPCLSQGPPLRAQDHGQLRQERLEAGQTFSIVGADHSGPYRIRNTTGGAQTVYLMHFVCGKSGYTHIEMQDELTGLASFNSWERLFSLYGFFPHTTILSDNATVLRAAGQALDLLCNEEKVEHHKDEFRAFFNKKMITVDFIPPRAPFASFWERHVGLFKQSFYKSASRSVILERDAFITLVRRQQGLLNSRPLTYSSNKWADSPILTPASFFRPTHDLTSVPMALPVSSRESDLSFNSMDVRCAAHNIINTRLTASRLLQDFWTAWSELYMDQLRERHIADQHRNKSGLAWSPKLGGIYLLKEPCTVRGSWPVVKVVHLYPGVDRVVRYVKVETAPDAKGKTRFYKRAMQFLIPLEGKNYATDKDDRSSDLGPGGETDETASASKAPINILKAHYSLRPRRKVNYND